MAHPISKLILWPIFKLFVKEIKGIENLPKGPFLVAVNHASYFDPALIVMLVAKYSNRKLRTFAIKERFTGPIWNLLFKWYGAKRVNGSLKKGLKALKEGDCLAVFPEAHRTLDGKVHKSKHAGLGILALKSKVPVVPIGLNTWHFWNKYRRLPNFKRVVKVHIGKPRTFKGKPTRKRAMMIVNSVMKDVAKLAGAKYA